MSQITLIPEKDMDDFVTIVANAYPGMDIPSPEDRQKVRQRLIKMQTEDKIAHIYGLYREKKLLGGMILYDFIMNVYNVKTLAGGVGLVAVDLLHKREKVCKDMITYFLDYYKEKGSFITCLYPFRPDFYREMGFGLGTKIYQYTVKPVQLPRNRKDHIQFLDKKDKKALKECYTRYTDKTHGMIELRETQLDRFFDKPENTIVGYKKDDTISGYLVFTFKKGDAESFIVNDIETVEFIYETKEALSELLTFLHTQKDQIRYVIINTQDEYFCHLLPDPRNNSERLIPSVYHESNVSGVGLMYRVIDTEKVFEVLKDHNFGNQDCDLNLSVTDSFFKENEGDIIVHFENGVPYLGRKDYEVEIRLDVSDFSSLVMGAVPFNRLYRYGLADISDPEYVDTVTALFRTKEKPVCTTEF
ncbi:MAG: GNAT family N-acetyltransferase [Theionarchaea archaeon]|nr:MAG: hypothetical protein AYK19_12540 [Theionarchaea archaeon DG-70-1]MBU7030501.1 GNAT family N-acetyltransferase [Theionarchaea archaeon]